MDIWKWVEEVQDELVHQGHHRMAHLMRVLPSYTVNENHAQLDALVPEALALARACLLYTSPSPRDKRQSRMPSSA